SMGKITYSLNLHKIRKDLDLSLMEYCVADCIYHLSNNPSSQIKGWCYASKETIARLKAQEKTQAQFVEERTLERLRTGTTQTQFFTFEEQEQEKVRERQRRARETRRQQLRVAGAEVIQEPSEKAFGVLSAPFETGEKAKILPEAKLAEELRQQRGFVTFKAPERIEKKEGKIITTKRELIIPSFKPTERFRVETPEQARERRKKAVQSIIGSIVVSKAAIEKAKVKTTELLPLIPGAIVGFKLAETKFAEKVTLKLPTTKERLIRTELPFGEFFRTLPTTKGLPLISKERAGVAATQVTALTGFGFGRTFEFAREKPLTFGVTLAAFELGIPLAGRGVAALTGVPLKAGKAVVGAGIFAGFAGIKEVQEPGSITTFAGGLATTTEFATFAFAAKGAGVVVRGARIVTDPRFIPFVKTSPE
ncbi:hypothetical protein LCGC14_2751940, partial [marine sediment metagenome]